MSSKKSLHVSYKITTLPGMCQKLRLVKRPFRSRPRQCGLEKLTQAFGMKWSIFNSYGVVDHPDEFNKNNTTALLSEIDS